VAQGNLTVKITETPQVSQPNAFAPAGSPTTFAPLAAGGIVPASPASPSQTNPNPPPVAGNYQPYSPPESNAPGLPGAPGAANVQFAPGGGGATVVVPRTNIQVDEQSDNRMALVHSGVSLQELVNNLNALGVGPRDMISILQAIKAAGALQADIELM
jgi:flagellar P-ring protein precursor FlgI